MDRPYDSNSCLFPFYHSLGHRTFICDSVRKCFLSLVSHTQVSVRDLFQKFEPGHTCFDLDCHLYMTGLSVTFTPDHLSLLPQETLNRLRNLAATFSTGLDDEQSRREDQSRIVEEGLSPESRSLLLVGSRQLLHQDQVTLSVNHFCART